MAYLVVEQCRTDVLPHLIHKNRKCQYGGKSHGGVDVGHELRRDIDVYYLHVEPFGETDHAVCPLCEQPIDEEVVGRWSEHKAVEDVRHRPKEEHEE